MCAVKSQLRCPSAAGEQYQPNLAVQTVNRFRFLRFWAVFKSTCKSGRARFSHFQKSPYLASRQSAVRTQRNRSNKQPQALRAPARSCGCRVTDYMYTCTLVQYCTWLLRGSQQASETGLHTQRFRSVAAQHGLNRKREPQQLKHPAPKVQEGVRTGEKAERPLLFPSVRRCRISTAARTGR